VLNEDTVLAMAPDDHSRVAAGAVSRSPDWYGTGHDDTTVWGVVAGSARNRYDVVVDLADESEPILGCTCPSRKHPCKHAIALLLRLVRGEVPTATMPASMVPVLDRSRVASREPPAPPRRSDEVVDPGAQAKRRERRAANVDAGVADLERWLDDLVAGGLAAARLRPYTAYDETAARLVDAQATGLANRVRTLSATVHGGPGWPERTLAEIGDLHLLIEGWRRVDRLPDPLAAQLRTQIGFTTTRGDVLATPPLRDTWDVVATIVIENPDLTSRRLWLRGETVGGWALLLDHVPAGGRFEVAAEVGSSFEADVHRYPGAGSARSLVGARHGEPVPMSSYEGSSVADALAGHALAVASNPWTSLSPIALEAVVPVDGEPWIVVDEAGDALPLAAPSWSLLAVSGGNPVGVIGEWTGTTLTPLSCWADGTLVRLA
jgi:hypothetical protein